MRGNMAFIPNKNYIKTGSRVKILENMIISSGMFTKGHEFTVRGVVHTKWKLEDDDGRIVYASLGANLERVDI